MIRFLGNVLIVAILVTGLLHAVSILAERFNDWVASWVAGAL
tara:strand:- start:46 stop:171 length:126 start_codon:yes stop_codon:yes gene_type:complete